MKESKVLEVVRRLARKKGDEVYLVGGAIRDLLLRRSLGKDFDFVVRGEVGELAKDVAQEVGGTAFPLDEAFGTWRVIIKKGKKKTELDFSLIQGKEILGDLKRRDFTANSVAINLNEVFQPGDLRFIDPLNGFNDIRERVLRANSEESLRQDPLRMLRAFRFSSTLGFSVEEETLRMIQRNRDRILHSAWERIRSEFFAGLGEMGAGGFLRDLHESGLLGVIIPEVRGWENFDQGTHQTLLEHAVRTVETGEIIFAHLPDLYPSYAKLLDQHFSSTIEEGISREALFKFVAFLHDSGKPATGSIRADGQPLRFLDHDQEGKRINLFIAQRMKLSRKAIRIVSEITRQHMRILSLAKTQKVTSRAQYRFFRDLGKEGIDVILLALANGLASTPIILRWPLIQELPRSLRKIKEVAGELLRYYFEEFLPKPPRPLLDGRGIMEALGILPGEEVGRLLERLREAEIAGKVRTQEEALEFLKNIDSSRPFGYHRKDYS